MTTTSNTVASLSAIITRGLATLREEIAAFEREGELWTALPGTANPPGVLALHLCGNLQHFIGATLGETGYVRDRDAEFAARDVERALVIDEIDRTSVVVETTLNRLDEDRLGQPFPLPEFFGGQSTAWALIHLAGHLHYHLGQINYARRYHTAAANDSAASNDSAAARVD